MGATNIVETGPSLGVSTVYLALAVAQTTVMTEKSGTLIATENKPPKAAAARNNGSNAGVMWKSIPI